MASLLKLECIYKSFGALRATDGVSLSVDEGEAVGLIGPNGAGKTTLFNLIAGGLFPTEGRIEFDGRDVTRAPPERRCRLGIGRSHQIPLPFTQMSVFENVLVGAMYGAALSGRDAYRRASEALEATGLYQKANVRARNLTLLQRKRLELARVLAVRPKLLLLDEIAGGLTEHECAELVKTIQSIHAGGATIVWIEHIVHAILPVTRRLVVMNFGKVLVEGEPRSVMTDPRVLEIYMGMPA